MPESEQEKFAFQVNKAVDSLPTRDGEKALILVPPGYLQVLEMEGQPSLRTDIHKIQEDLIALKDLIRPDLGRVIHDNLLRKGTWRGIPIMENEFVPNVIAINVDTALAVMWSGGGK